MFWNSATNSSSIEAVLDQPDVKLETVLDQDEVLQECRSTNKRLLEFLLRPEHMNSMLDLITKEPSYEISMANQYKYPNIACEILTSDITFAEKIAGDKSFMEKLFHFFRDSSPPLNPLLASYVCRVLSEIVARKLDQNWYSYQLNVIQILGYLQSEERVIEWLLNHIGTSAVCDFLYKLIINLEGPDMRGSLTQWMVEKENFIFHLMSKMKGNDKDVHSNISRLVGDLLFAFRDDMSSANEADPFLVALKCRSTMGILNLTIFEKNTICESKITHGLDLVLALLGITKKPPKQPTRSDSLDETNDNIILHKDMIWQLTERFDQLSALLSDPPDTCSIKLTYGVVEKPLGSIRLAIAKYVAHLFTLHSEVINSAVVDHGILEKLMELFWEHPWNNFLHRYVSKILIHIAIDDVPCEAAINFLVLKHGLLERIVTVFQDSKIKCGYRGHLAKVSAAWGDASTRSGIVKDTIKQLEPPYEEKWDTFYYDTLEEYQQREKVLLAGAHPPAPGTQLATPGMSYDSDPGLTWGALSSAAASASGLNTDFDSSSDTFSAVDRFDDGKSKALFELFCTEKSNTVHLDDDFPLPDGEDEDEDGHFQECNTMHNESFNSRMEEWGTSMANLNESIMNEIDSWTADDFTKKVTITSPRDAWLAELHGRDPEEHSPLSPPIHGCDPWSGFGVVQASGNDPWADTQSQPNSANSNSNEKWADFDSPIKFTLNNETKSSPPVEDLKDEENL